MTKRPAPHSVYTRLIGQTQQGNIDLSNRPQVKNPDGSVSTVRSISIEQDGQTILIPTVVNGKVVSDQEAIQHFQKSGEHLGVFADHQSANQFAQNCTKRRQIEFPKVRKRSSYRKIRPRAKKQASNFCHRSRAR